MFYTSAGRWIGKPREYEARGANVSVAIRGVGAPRLESERRPTAEHGMAKAGAPCRVYDLPFLDRSGDLPPGARQYVKLSDLQIGAQVRARVPCAWRRLAIVCAGMCGFGFCPVGMSQECDWLLNVAGACRPLYMLRVLRPVMQTQPHPEGRCHYMAGGWL